MSTELDLDDVAHGHPLATRELFELRAENERLRAALARVHNFVGHPGGHPSDRSEDSDDPASWRHGWICAIDAVRDVAK